MSDNPPDLGIEVTDEVGTAERIGPAPKEPKKPKEAKDEDIEDQDE